MRLRRLRPSKRLSLLPTRPQFSKSRLRQLLELLNNRSRLLRKSRRRRKLRRRRWKRSRLSKKQRLSKSKLRKRELFRR